LQNNNNFLKSNEISNMSLTPGDEYVPTFGADEEYVVLSLDDTDDGDDEDGEDDEDICGYVTDDETAGMIADTEQKPELNVRIISSAANDDDDDT
jgi:hypothetical protein